MEFNNCMKWVEFLLKDSDLPSRGLRMLCREQVRAQHGEPVELTIGLKGMSGLCTLGRSYRCEGLLCYGVSLRFR
jgi:hypothetical protein